VVLRLFELSKGPYGSDVRIITHIIANDYMVMMGSLSNSISLDMCFGERSIKTTQVPKLALSTRNSGIKPPPNDAEQHWPMELLSLRP
jgi:hypothetical protein